MAEPIIQYESVSKCFGSLTAVENLSLQVPAGKVYGLLGHNGSGKSTSLGILLGQVRPTRGRVSIAGRDVFRQRRAALARVGAIYETPAFYDYLTGYRNLKILCEYTAPLDRKRLEEVVDMVGLTDRIGSKVATYSHGMRQRLAIAQALLPDPRLLILDEPSDGLDPQGIHEMRSLILRLNQQMGLTVLFSSHILSEVEQLCDQLAVLNAGRLVFEGRWRQVGLKRNLLRLTVDREEAAHQALRQAGLIGGGGYNGMVEMTPGVEPERINAFLVEREFAVRALMPYQPTLEDVYLHLIREERAS